MKVGSLTKVPSTVRSYVMAEDPLPSNALQLKWEGPCRVERRTKRRCMLFYEEAFCI